MKEQKQNQLFVFRKVKNQSLQGEFKEHDHFVLHKRIRVKEIEIFDAVCMNFFFKKVSVGNPDTLLFTKEDLIFSFNFETEEIKIEYNIINSFDTQPDFFDMDDSQNLILVSNETDSLWINLEEKKEVDMDELYGIGLIKASRYDSEDHEFYLLCN